MISNELTRKNISCSIITARINREWPSWENIDNLKILRLGNNIDKWLHRHRWMIQYLNLINKNHLKQRRLFSDLEFWIGLPAVWKQRQCFIKTLLKEAEINKWRFDIVHVFESSWLAGVGDWLAEITGAKTICRCASWPAWQPIPYDAPMRRILEKRRFNPNYAAMNYEMVKNLIENGIAKKKCFLVPNGVEVPKTASDVKNSDNVLYVGNFSQGDKWKGFDLLIQAWAKVIKNVPLAHLIMVGGGDSAIWKRMAKSLGCNNNITWVGETRDTASYYSKGGIFVLPSRIEGMSNALLEAQSWGLACVVSDIPGNKAVVENGKNGIQFPKEDINQLAESIVMLLKNPEMRLELGTEARRRTENHFALPAVVERWIQVYKTIINA
ncbi:MAG: glycosyltransferase family 4 protein [Promethearchaeota archaeon]